MTSYLKANLIFSYVNVKHTSKTGQKCYQNSQTKPKSIERSFQRVHTTKQVSLELLKQATIKKKK